MKLTVLTRRIYTLVGVAYSPKYRMLFLDRKSYSVEIVPPKLIETPGNWPGDASAWNARIEEIMSRLGYPPGREIISKDAKKMDLNPVKTFTVHAECNLAAYLCSRPQYPTLSYLGVSKRSCRTCYNWLVLLRSYYLLRFYTRGSHGQWCPGWAAPALPPTTGPTPEPTQQSTTGPTAETKNEFRSPRQFYMIFLNDLEKQYKAYIDKEEAQARFDAGLFQRQFRAGR